MQRAIGRFTLGSFVTNTEFWLGTVASTFFINILDLVLPVFIIHIYDRVITNKSLMTLYAFFFIGLISLTLELVLKIARGYLSSWYEARFSYKIIKSSVQQILFSKYKDYEKITASQHLNNINAVEVLGDIFTASNITLVCDAPFLVVYLSLLYIIHPLVALVSFIVVVIICVYHYYDYKGMIVHLTTKKKNTSSKTKFLVEVLSGIHTVKSLGLEEQLLRRYEMLEKKSINDTFSMIEKQMDSTRVITGFSQLILVITIITCAFLYFNKLISVGGMAASVLISGKIIQPVAKLIGLIGKIAKARLAYEDADSIYNLRQETHDEGIKFQIERGYISFNDVSFTHADKQIFRHVNLFLPENSIVSVQGEGLSGKTSLLYLIAGIYSPTSGAITIDDHNLADLDIEFYRKQIGFMAQDGKLFQGSILNNILMFDMDYEDEVKPVCNSVGVLTTIENMTNGFKTEVGKGAVDFISKGDKQKIIMARALLHVPKLILFDEANSSLDKESDEDLINFIKSYVGKCTMILISHRPSIIKLANLHYKIENKKIINTGMSYD